MPLARLAEHAAMLLHAQGWRSRERARRSGGLATGDAALRPLHTTPDAPGPADVALARGALLWARELLAAQAQLSPFERDAVTVAGAGRLLTARERGLVCAMIAVYRSPRARHLGQPGEWLERVVVVERIAEQPSPRHGAVCRHDMVDVAAQPARVVADPRGPAAARLGRPRARASRAPHRGARRTSHRAHAMPSAGSPSAVAARPVAWRATRAAIVNVDRLAG